MNIEERISKLEKQNRYYKIALAMCLCMFMVSAKDIFIKDEIVVDKIYARELILYDKELKSVLTFDYQHIIEYNGDAFLGKQSLFFDSTLVKHLK